MSFPDAPWTTESGYDRYRNAFYGLTDDPARWEPDDDEEEEDDGDI